MSPVDESLFARDQEVLRQRYGPDVISQADKAIDIERIPLDFPGLMRITGGGIPIGRVTRAYGAESSGKTMLSYLIIAAAQRYRSKRFPNGLSCVYWNIEQQFDEVFARHNGIDTSRLGLMNDITIIEDIAAAMELLLSSVHLHVIDSASFATPMEELAGKDKSKNPEYQVQMGAHSRAWKRALNRIHSRMDQESNVVVIIDHVGRNMQTGAEEPLSGRRMAYRSDLSLHMKSGPWLFYNKHGHLDTNDKIKADEGQGPAGMKEPDGREVSIRVAKSRVCRPLRVCKMRVDFNFMRFDPLWELADSATYYDDDGEPAHRSGKPPIVSKTSNGFYKMPGHDKALHGFDAFYEALRGDDFTQNLIRVALLRGK